MSIKYKDGYDISLGVTPKPPKNGADNVYLMKIKQGRHNENKKYKKNLG